MTSRRYGILCLLTAVCWTFAVAMVLIGVAVGVYSALLGASAVLTHSPTGERDAHIAFAVLTTAVVGAAALALLTIVLDVAVTDVGANSLALLAGALEMREVAAALWWRLAGTVVGLAPWTRPAQFIGGIVETARTSAPSHRSSVGPLP